MVNVVFIRGVNIMQNFVLALVATMVIIGVTTVHPAHAACKSVKQPCKTSFDCCIDLRCVGHGSDKWCEKLKIRAGVDRSEAKSFASFIVPGSQEEQPATACSKH